jgi:hypothetical protein
MGGSPPQAGLRTDRIDLPSPINQPPDPNAQMRLRRKHADQLKIDAANTLRRQQISDETMKLLILARDLRSKLEHLGSGMPSEKLIREVEFIETFAHDVQEKMVLTPGPG